MRADEIMTRNVVTVEPGTKLSDALALSTGAAALWLVGGPQLAVVAIVPT